MRLATRAAASIALAADASRLASLLLSYTPAVCAFVAPRQPGASTAIIDRLSHSRALSQFWHEQITIRGKTGDDPWKHPEGWTGACCPRFENGAKHGSAPARPARPLEGKRPLARNRSDQVVLGGQHRDGQRQFVDHFLTAHRSFGK
jgi:hypothetical protein